MKKAGLENVRAEKVMVPVLGARRGAGRARRAARGADRRAGARRIGRDREHAARRAGRRREELRGARRSGRGRRARAGSWSSTSPTRATARRSSTDRSGRRARRSSARWACPLRRQHAQSTIDSPERLHRRLRHSPRRRLEAQAARSPGAGPGGPGGRRVVCPPGTCRSGTCRGRVIVAAFTNEMKLVKKIATHPLLLHPASAPTYWHAAAVLFGEAFVEGPTDW